MRSGHCCEHLQNGVRLTCIGEQKEKNFVRMNLPPTTGGQLVTDALAQPPVRGTLFTP